MPLHSVIPSIPQRWIVCSLCCLVITFFSIEYVWFKTLVYIVHFATGGHNKANLNCPFLYNESSWEELKLPFVLPEFYWVRDIIDIGDNAYFIGASLTSVPAGVLSDIGYPKYVLIAGILSSVFTYLLHPTLQKYETAFVLLSMVDGVGKGFIVPSILSLTSRWAPASERNTLISFIVAGIFYGTAIGKMLFKPLYTSWTFGKYASGMVGLVLVAFCFVFVYNSPEESPFISQRECDIITGSFLTPSSLNRRQKLRRIPWCKIMTSIPFLAYVLVFNSFWMLGFMIIFRYFYYQRYILHFPNIDITPVMVSLAVVPSLLISGFLSDWAQKHKLASKTVVKRVYTIISVVCSSVLMGVAYLVGCDVLLFWVLAAAAAYFLGPGYIFSTAVDLSPKNAGLLTGIAWTCRALFMVFKLRVDAVFFYEFCNPDMYRNRHFIFATIYFLMTLPFLFFGSGETQIWRKSRRTRTNLRGTVYSLASRSMHQFR